MRGGVKLLSYPHFSLPEPSYICSGASSPPTVQLSAAVQNIPPLINRCHLPGQSLNPWCPSKSVSNPLPGSPQTLVLWAGNLLHGDVISVVPLPLCRSHLWCLTPVHFFLSAT